MRHCTARGCLPHEAEVPDRVARECRRRGACPAPAQAARPKPASRAHDGLRAGADFQLVEHGRHLVAHGLLAERQVGGDLRVVQSAREPFEQFSLARRQGGEHARVVLRRVGVMRRQEVTDLAEAMAEGRFMAQQHVIGAFERHEAGTRNQPGQVPAFVEGHAGVAARMQHDRRAAHLRGQLAHVDLGKGGHGAGRVRRARRQPLQLIEPGDLFGPATGQVQRGEGLPEGRVVAPPAEFDHLQEQGGLAPLLGRGVAAHRSARVATQQHQRRHPLRMPHRIGHRDGGALRATQQRKAIEAGGADHGFEVGHPGVERQRRLGAV